MQAARNTLLFCLIYTALWSQPQATPAKVNAILDSLSYLDEIYTTQPLKASELAQRVHNFGLRNEIDSITCKANLYLAASNYYAGQYRTSNQHYQQILNDGICSNVDSAMLFNNMGINHEFLGAFDEAIKAYLNSVTIEEARGNLLGKYMTWINIGLVAMQNNDYPTALNYLNGAKNYFQTTRDSSMLALCYQNKGITFVRMEQKDSIAPNIDKAMQLYEAMNNKAGIFELFYNVAMNYTVYRPDYPQALQNIQQAEAILPQLSPGLQDRYRPSLASLKGRYFMVTKAYQQAKYWYNTIYDYRKQQGGIEYRNLLINLTRIYGYEGNITAMDTSIQAWIAITDSIYQASTSNQLAAVRVNYEVDALQQNLAIEKLKRKALLVSSRLRLVGLFLTLALAAALYFRYREQKKLNRTLFLLNQDNLRGSRQVLNNEFASLQDRYDELIRLIEEEQLFLDPNLDRDTIIQKLNTNSAYFNELIKCSQYPNFSWLINAYRINHAKLRLIEGNYENTTEVYQEAGFNNRANWNRVFKRHTGMTPSSFIEQLKEANKNS